MTTRRDGRWGVGLLGAVALTGFGLLFASALLVTAAIIPLTYVLYGTISRVPEDLIVSAERTIAPASANPGQRVDVTLSVENAGDRTLTDVRIIDGIPEELAVTSGSPRLATPLSPGEEVSIHYSVVAKRGEFSFADPVVRVRSFAAEATRTVECSVTGDGVLNCGTSIPHSPVRNGTLSRAGTLPTDSGGSGLEFFATRNYRLGDPMTRIDWNHLAKTGEFVTIQYREEQAARIVLIIDARAVGRVTAAAGYPTGTALCAYAGERLFDALDSTGVITSVTAVGLEDDAVGDILGPDGLLWVDPDEETRSGMRPSVVFEAVNSVADDGATAVSMTSPGVGRRGESNSDPHAGASVVTPDHPSAVTPDPTVADVDEEAIGHVLARLPPNAQVILCSPLLDNWPVELARTLSTHGYPLVVVSPDVLTRPTVGQRLARIPRNRRLDALERTGETVDWNPDVPVDYALRLSLPHVLTQQ